MPACMLHFILWVAVFLEQMYEAVKLLENILEE